MNRFQKALTVGMLVSLLALVSLLSFSSNLLAVDDDVPTEPEAAVAEATTELEAVYRQREETYLQQIETLGAARLEREATYQGQVSELMTQVAGAQARLNALTAQEEALRQQLSQLNVVRVERIAAYQQQLDEVTAQYNVQQPQLQSRLNEAQAKLAEANAILGR